MEFTIKGLDFETLLKLFDNLVYEITYIRKALEHIAEELVAQNEAL